MSFSTRTTPPARSTDKAGSAGGQRLRRRIHAPKPHEQGAWALRFVPDGAMVRVDGERPTSRGRSPAAFWGMGRRRFGRVGGALGNAGNAKFGGSAVFGMLRGLGVAEFGVWEIEIWGLGDLRWIWGTGACGLGSFGALGGRALGGACGQDRLLPFYYLFVPAKGHIRLSPPPRLPSPNRRLPASPPHLNRTAAPKPPARGAWARQPGAEGTGSRHCRLLIFGAFCCKMK